MNQFIARYSNCILGVLSGFDRMLFRGTIRQLADADGLGKFLNWKRIRLVDFGKFVESVSEAVGRAAEQQAKAAGRPWLYLASASVDKDALARQHAVPAGLACVLRCVEPCQAFELHRNSETKHLEPRLVLRKCLHYFLLPALAVWMDASPRAELVAVVGSRVHQWARVAGSTNDGSRFGVRAAG